jgi:hypothetical protein
MRYHRFLFFLAVFLMVLPSVFATMPVQAAQAGSILIRVADSRDKPLASAIVLIESDSPDFVVTASSTDQNGGVWFRDLPVQNGYSITVLASGFEDETETISVKPDKIRQVPVQLKQKKPSLFLVIAH